MLAFVLVLLAAALALVIIATMLVVDLAAEAIFLRFGYKYFRQVDLLPREVAFGVVYIPLSSAAASLFLGVGVNIFTDGGKLSNLLFGTLLVVGGLYALLRVSVLVAKEMVKTTGLTASRQAFSKASRIIRGRENVERDELLELVRKIDRLERVGVRLVREAGALGLRSWIRRRWSLKKIFFTATVQGASLIYLIIVVVAWALRVYSGDDLQYAIVVTLALGLSLAASIIAPILSWKVYKRRQVAIGSELHDDSLKLVGPLRRKLDLAASDGQKGQLVAYRKCQKISLMRALRNTFGRILPVPRSK